MNRNHKHYQVAKQWLEGKQIQCRLGPPDAWEDTSCPVWANDYEYRVKPEIEVIYCQLTFMPISGQFSSKRISDAMKHNANLAIDWDLNTNAIVGVRLIEKGENT